MPETLVAARCRAGAVHRTFGAPAFNGDGSVNRIAQDPAGAISVQLTTRKGRVDAVRLASSRPTNMSQQLFAGRTAGHLLATLPLVYSVCATAQASAAVQACENAAGIAPDPAHVRARQLLVHAETAREHLFRILLGWSGWLGMAPPASDLQVLGRMRPSWGAALYPGGDAFRIGGGGLDPDPAALAGLIDDLNGLIETVLGDEMASWSAQLVDEDGLRDWAASGSTVTQRMLGEVIGRGAAGLGASPVAGLPPTDDATLATLLASDQSSGFVAAPQWAGTPCETGAFERESSNLLVAALCATHGNALLARLVARLTELIDLVGQMRCLVEDLVPAEAANTMTGMNGDGIAQLEAARGRLVHWVRLEDDVVRDYRILAPTEWNFHPQGALAQGLLTLPAGNELPQLARLLVDAIDPCVDATVEVVTDA